MRISRSSHRNTRSQRVAKVVVNLLGLIVLGVGGVVGWQFMIRQWDGQARYTLVRTNPLIIESFDPATGEGIRMKVPNELEMETAGGRGVWRAEVMPELADKFGWEWFKDSMGWYFEIPITAVDQDWTIWDKWAWLDRGRKVQWKDVDLADTTWVRSRATPDEVQVLGLTENWDTTARRWFESAKLASEQLDVRIVNTTNSVGLGGKAARIVEHAGIRVVRLTNTDQKVENCRVEGTKADLKLAGVRIIVQTFGCDTGPISDESVSEVQWVLGEGFRNRWMGEE